MQPSENQMPELKPNGERAKNAITLIWIILAIEIISLISGGFEYRLLYKAAKGYELTMEIAHANDLRVQIISAIFMIAMIISGIIFILWFRRAYYNLHLKVKGLTYAEGWAAGGWFVPIAYFFVPYQIMKELFEETKKLLVKEEIYFNDKISSNPLGLWWTLWIASSFIGTLMRYYARIATTIDEYLISTILSMVNNIIGIILVFLIIKIIKNYSSLESLLIGETKIRQETLHF